MLAGLAYDGLVAYRRVPGVAGATLVGGLATRPPKPSPDGRTYVFTLRRGIRYSDGTPVRPGDFRASMERFLRVSRDTFPPFFTGIVGARRCISEPGAVRPLARHRVGCARADDHRPPDRARPGLPPQADDAVRVRRARRHARARGRQDLRAARHRPLPHRALGRAPRRRARAQPALPADRHAAGRVPGPDRGQGHPARTPRDAHRGGRPRHRGCDVARGRPPARSPPGPRRARARPAAHHSIARGLVDVPQRAAAAVRRHPRPPGGQPRRRPRRVGRAVRRSRRSPLRPARSCRPRSRASRRTAPTPRTRRAAAGGPRRTSSARAAWSPRPAGPARA